MFASRSHELLADRRTAEDRTASPAVELSNVTRVFGIAPGLVRADLRIGRGDTVFVRGPNGAGKTTLLRVIATAISPTYGGGRVLGFDLVRERDEVRRRTELMGHRTRLYDDLTARENLRFACALYGLDPSGISEALDRVGLADAADERVRGYSQGMRQRVALARAEVRRPELLLLDEPYAGLDAEAKDVVDRVIHGRAASGGTVIVATHDPTRGALATRTVYMDAGRLLPELVGEEGR